MIKINVFRGKHNAQRTAIDFIKYIGPGLLVTVGFIDPGNWASNVSAGADYGYSLLWIVTLSTIMLVVLQHNAAHLGIVTGDCLSEAVSKRFKPWLTNIILYSAIIASISTAMAELLGGAIALNMIFKLPIKLGTLIMLTLVIWMLFSNSYKKLEKLMIGFVSIIGLSFLFELLLIKIDWNTAVVSFVKPTFPKNSMPIIMSVLGAVVMPHNLFLHSEIIQSRQWNLEKEEVIKRQLRYEFLDTIISMLIGFAINSAMILLSAATFFKMNIRVNELSEAQSLLKPLLGGFSAGIFAIALLFAGIASTVTAGMAGGSIFAGIYKEPYDIKDSHTKVGVIITLISAAVVIFFISNPFKGLIYSQMLLSIELPITIFTQIYLTSSKKVMGKFVNSVLDKISLVIIGVIVTFLNLALLISYL
ncbi:Nramp family divalent metal transporter [Clostridium felsineum]|uniref:Divalent metal cation transporter MntH n=1 Tax=Clostridium felsineum TaxID=36839 RepID=A0A1S8MG09_9CLOT|nr:Nramp family divalent metal transporter [Clostridium felsineum]URZ05357.1 Divalent metal cation transporter MntH [Clostridium felsineum]URZ10398.1 Divalent metal cation transporter MntH [Clostridium felsineum]